MTPLEEKVASLEGWCDLSKANIIAELTREVELEHGKCLALEIGVYGARSLVALGWYLKAPSHVFGVDPYTVEASLESEQVKENREWWANLDHEKIKQGAFEGIREKQDVISLLVMKSKEACELFDDCCFDVIHQDGNHSEEISCQEVEMWTDKLRDGGWWIMDDVNWKSTGKAQELLVTKGFVEIEHHGTWALYQKL
jgi:hypothetical protein